MIKRYSFTKIERYGDIGAVMLTIETGDNQADTRIIADALARAVEGLQCIYDADGNKIEPINLQIVDFHEEVSHKTPHLLGK